MSVVTRVVRPIGCGRPVHPSARRPRVDLQVLAGSIGRLASHELRTPLTLVLGNAELLLDGKFGDLDEEPRSAVERIHRYALALTRSLTETLDLMQLLQGGGQIRLELVDPAALGRELIADWQSEAQAKGVTLDGGFDGLALVQAEGARLRQAIGHVIDRAIQSASAGGQIRLEGRLQGNDVILQVADTGLGSDARRLALLLGNDTAREAYAQGDPGVGLLFAKVAIEAMGGRMGIDGDEGSGTVVRLRLPVRTETAAKRP